MANPYFRNIPDFEYVSRAPEPQNISDYTTVKNLFKRGKLREEIFGNLNFFTKYNIIGDERPDNVASKIYNDETLDWVILLSNNILNIRTEWPMPQRAFDTYLQEKYRPILGSNKLYDLIDGRKVKGMELKDVESTFFSVIHHYESPEIRNSQGITILKKGLRIPQNFSVSYYDSLLDINETKSNIAIPITNFEFEDQIQNKKRNIFILKPIYLNVVYNDLDSIMPYKQGSEQYLSRTLKRGDNIRLYQ
jgi:hypothetical protein